MWVKKLTLVLAAGLVAVLAEPGHGGSVPRETFAKSLCAAAETEASKAGIDGNFFVRLLWKESMFDPNAVSPKGAQGIAQFMPGTAELRGLEDPFEPYSAVAASAQYLAELKKTFGNHGLAAAAYNAGEARVTRWVTGQGGMPEETRDYVAFVTGKEVEVWRDPAAAHSIPTAGNDPTLAGNCVKLALNLKAPSSPGIRTSKRMPWGAMVASHFRQDKALSMFQRLKVRFPGVLAGKPPMVVRKKNLSRGSKAMALVMLGAATREEAQKICASLAAVGAACVVRKGR